MKRQTGSFKADGDDGRQYTVCIYSAFADAGQFGGPKVEVEVGAKELRTTGGKIVRYVQKGEYEIVETGVILRSNSPGAP
ncbi:MAG: hypothetical protein ABSH41_27465 [Syntrophobacteraceae bacterium]|jgi:hypothetical protein